MIAPAPVSRVSTGQTIGLHNVHILLLQAHTTVLHSDEVCLRLNVSVYVSTLDNFFHRRLVCK